MKKHATAAREAVFQLIDGLAAGEQLAIGGLPAGRVAGLAPLLVTPKQLREDFEAVFQPRTVEPILWWAAFLQANSGLQVSSAVHCAVLYLPAATAGDEGQRAAASRQGGGCNVARYGPMRLRALETQTPTGTTRVLSVRCDGTIVYGIGFNWQRRR
jgi:hypothetical protein